MPHDFFSARQRGARGPSGNNTAELLDLIDRQNAYRVTYQTPVIVDASAGLIRYGRMLIARENEVYKVVDPADYGLTTFDLPYQTGLLADYHYIDVASIAPAQTSVSPVKRESSGAVVEEDLLHVGLGTTFARTYTPFTGAEVIWTNRTNTDIVTPDGLRAIDDTDGYYGTRNALYLPIAPLYNHSANITYPTISNAESAELAGYCKIVRTGSAGALAYSPDNGLFAYVEYTGAQAYYAAHPGRCFVLAAWYGGNRTSDLEFIEPMRKMVPNLLYNGKGTDGYNARPFVSDPITRVAPVSPILTGAGFEAGWKSAVNGRVVTGIDFAEPVAIGQWLLAQWYVESSNNFASTEYGSAYIGHPDGTQTEISQFNNAAIRMVRQLAPNVRLYSLLIQVAAKAASYVMVGMGPSFSGAAHSVFGVQIGTGPGSRISLADDDYPVQPYTVQDNLPAIEGDPYLGRARMNLLRLASAQTADLDGTTLQHHIVLSPCDSFTAIKEAWSTDFTRAMKARYGNAGPGWCGFGYHDAYGEIRGCADPAEMAVSFSGSWVGTYGTDFKSPDLSSATSGTAGSRVMVGYFSTAQIALLELHYTGAIGAAVRYRFNGGAWAALSLAATGGQKAAISGAPAGAWQLEIEVVSGTVTLSGLFARNDLPGIIVSNLAVSGSGLVGSWSALLHPSGASYRADLIAAFSRLDNRGRIDQWIALIGTNDQRVSADPRDYGKAMIVFVRGMIRAVSPLASVLWAVPCENGLATGPAMRNYATAARLTARELKIAFVDMQPSFGASFADYDDLFGTDDLHPNAIGGKIQSDMLQRVLMGDSAADALKTEMVALVEQRSGLPTLRNADWDEETFDAAGRRVRGKDGHARSWRARQGMMSRQEAPELGLATLRIEDFDDVTYHSNGALKTATDLRKHVWRRTPAGLVRDDAPGVPATEMRSADWDSATYNLDGSFREGVRRDRSAWIAEGGRVVEDLRLPSLRQNYAFNGIYGTGLLSSAADVDYLMLILGQSIGRGNNNDGDAMPVTTVPPFPGFALMIGDSPWWATGKLSTHYSDLVEVKEPGTTTGAKETICSGMACAMMPALAFRLGFMPRIIFASVCLGGNAYYGGAGARNGMKRGSLIYGEVLNTVRAAVAISRRAGRRLIVPAALPVHGEQDFAIGTSERLYGRGMDQWTFDINADIRAITGQTDPVRMYFSQVNRGSNTAGVTNQIAQAQLMAERNPLIRNLGSYYALDHAYGDGSHPDAIGYFHKGLHHGVHIVNDLFGAYDQCLSIVDVYWATTSSIDLVFSEPIDIEANDDRVNISNLGPGLGIDYTDRSNSASVTGITRQGSNIVRVALSGAPTGTRRRLFIASRTTGDGGMGRLTGARSGIRSFDPVILSPTDSFPIYRWAPTQTINLPAF